ncbi:MAG: hypothetical protein WEA09_04790 [Gemmatimonadota bacterium]
MSTSPSRPVSRMRTVSPLTLVLILIALPFLVGACASTGGSGTSRSSTFISTEEIDARPGLQTAYEVIEQLRPNWLRTRGSVSLQAPAEASYPIIFMNGRRLGDMNMLRSIPISDVGSARFMSAREATTLHGTGYPAGIIDISTRRD